MRQPHVVYSPQIARRICEGWAAGEPMTEICREPGMPHPETVKSWVRERADFRAMFEAARARRMELFARRPGLEKRARGLVGRGSSYNVATAARICARIAAGESLRGLAKDRSLPTARTIYNWLAERQDFRIAYQAACDVRAEGLVEEALAIADDDRGDLIERPDGRLVGNAQAVSRARLQVEARRWAARQMQPRVGWADGPGKAEADGPQCYEDLLGELLQQRRDLTADKARRGAAAGPEGPGPGPGPDVSGGVWEADS